MNIHGYDYTVLMNVLQAFALVPIALVTIYASYKAGIMIENLLTLNRKGK